MLKFTVPAAAVDEPKTARLEQRAKPSVKAAIQQAAALLGVDETTFVLSAALERARATIRDHEGTRLSAADREAFLAALDAPPQASAALMEAARLHRARVEDGG